MLFVPGLADNSIILSLQMKNNNNKSSITGFVHMPSNLCHEKRWLVWAAFPVSFHPDTRPYGRLYQLTHDGRLVE